MFLLDLLQRLLIAKTRCLGLHLIDLVDEDGIAGSKLVVGLINTI